MCGIFGWVSRNAGDRLGTLRTALKALEHRGPDGEGVWFHETSDGHQIALGHRRLSIIDLAGGAQPLFSHDERFAITFNGEVYNYIELRQELTERGHTFRTASDTEVVVEAYRAWGLQSLSRLRGMFAFALWDHKEQRLLLARDGFGKKPLFLAETACGFVFGSEIAPLLDFPGVDRTLAEGVLGEYLLSRYVAGPGTFFRGVRKLQPGCYEMWSEAGRSEGRYFTPPLATTAPSRMSENEALARFTDALDEAVRIRMRSDAPFGAYLSGGLDSSVIAALMTRHSRGPVATFSVGFDDAKLSELSHARRVASLLGTNHDEMVVTPGDFAANWADAVRHRGAPVSEASDIPILLLSRRARDSVKMVLTGEGADELLAGYPKFRAERYVDSYHRIVPALFHRSVLDPLAQSLPYGFRRLKILSRALGEATLRGRERVWFASGSTEAMERLLGRSIPLTDTHSDVPSSVSMSPLRQLQLHDQLTWLPDNLLERGDRMMMGGSIEGRMPFMDTELAKLVATIPDSMLARGAGKWILREAANKLIDRETITRRKLGFQVPIGDWFRAEQRDVIYELTTSRASNLRRLLDAGVIDRIIAEHMSGRQNHERVVWTLANLELFLREFKPSGYA